MLPETTRVHTGLGFQTGCSRGSRLLCATLVVLLLAPELSFATVRILTVGDGSFAFSASLRARLDRMDGTFDLMATSFDSNATVLKKYPESRTLLPRLAKHSGVIVMHDVDATRLEASDVVRWSPFDLIIWNFPHSGTEDSRRHCALLAHFFESSKSILCSCGQVQVALANEQPSLWAVEELALRAGLVMVEARVFDPEREFPGYTPRRHHAATSFQRTGPSRAKMRAHRFTFSNTLSHSKAVADSKTGRPAVWLPAEIVEEGSSVRDDDSIPKHRSWSAGKRPACKRLHVQQCHESEGGGAHAQGGVWQSAGQGEAGQGRSSGDLGQPGNTTDVVCQRCARQFRDLVALEQHTIAKHGRHSGTKPDRQDSEVRSGGESRAVDQGPRISPNSSASAAQDTEHSQLWWCPVCFMWWRSRAEHLQSLKPVEPLQRSCACGRIFLSSRALLQHSNFCSVSCRPP